MGRLLSLAWASVLICGEGKDNQQLPGFSYLEDEAALLPFLTKFRYIT